MSAAFISYTLHEDILCNIYAHSYGRTAVTLLMLNKRLRERLMPIHPDDSIIFSVEPMGMRDDAFCDICDKEPAVVIIRLDIPLCSIELVFGESFNDLCCFRGEFDDNRGYITLDPKRFAQVYPALFDAVARYCCDDAHEYHKYRSYFI